VPQVRRDEYPIESTRDTVVAKGHDVQIILDEVAHVGRTPKFERSFA
jgi:hypothetical protein